MLKLRSLSELTSMIGGSGTRSKTVSSISKMARLDKMMKKMARKDDRNDKWFLAPLCSQKAIGSHKGKPRYSTLGTKRKAEYISDLLFDPICQIMCRGVLEPRVKVELSKISILADFSCIKVHWLASDKDDHVMTEKILQNKTVAMQDLVKELQIMANVPPVRFVKDMSLASVEQVERLLQQADLGPPDEEEEDSCDDEEDKDETTETRLEAPVDIPVTTSLKDIAKRFRSEDTKNLQLNEGLDENVNTQVNSDPTTQVTDITQRFRQDMYGLNHESMTQKLSVLRSGLRKTAYSLEIDPEPEEIQSKVDRKQAREQYAKVLQIQRNQRYSLRKERKKKHILMDYRDENEYMENISQKNSETLGEEWKDDID
ncbi:uncharacterized protein LOC110442715 [Mizuhopecten yessoensis]|uniref:Ribosome-binding factor A, mitochondrial n=1 Tax=Mizuhopecten yessoensis TaxID=6573 RepID=A0A210PGN5_MIZYE|nr:uncharacterized protein LOC110442715 [Mizuhopecten yessoensis]OWF35631.1 ribosome-binding factor A, mitochondrial [Mizuhopecten yessoensis]